MGITFTWSNIDKNSGIVATQAGSVSFSPMVLRMKLLEKNKKILLWWSKLLQVSREFYYGIVDSSFVQTKKIKTAESKNES